jgi:peptidoglycan/LPS O-acetylase OafA/YrhL
VIRDQRKTIVVGLVLAVASFWILGQLGEWRIATSLAIGVALGLLNHLATERWLLGMLTAGREPTRAAMMRSTMVRLAVLTVVAVAVAVFLWPDGIGGLLGLGVFRLIALAMTTIPLLKELKSQ